MFLSEAKRCDILVESQAKVAFSIVAMQEMNYIDTQKYFGQMRLLNVSWDHTLYCRSRESITLPDGQVIQFEKYS